MFLCLVGAQFGQSHWPRKLCSQVSIYNIDVYYECQYFVKIVKVSRRSEIMTVLIKKCFSSSQDLFLHDLADVASLCSIPQTYADNKGFIYACGKQDGRCTS